MITNNEINFSGFRKSSGFINLNMKSRILVRFARWLKANDIAYKLEFYERMLNFIRVVGLKALSQNLHIKLNRNDALGKLPVNFEDRISSSFIDFLFQFEIIVHGEEGLAVNEEYRNLLEEHRINKLTERFELPRLNGFSSKEISAIHDFLFVIDLVKKYNTADYKFQQVNKHQHIWESLIISKKLDYEIRLCETLFNLINLKIPEKIESPFDEDYYTESGQNAFKNYTQYSFPRYLREITHGRDSLHILDLGCGYGNYMEVISKNFPDSRVTGIEKNAKVYKATKKKFEKIRQIKIINKDFFDFKLTENVDVVLLNYVLFYFNADGKRKVIEKARNILNSNGSIVLCQYFSGIEDLKEELAKMQGESSVAKKIEMYYSNKILYANTLWNDAVDTFSEAVNWDEFKTMLDELNLEIVSMTNADRFYYSLFVELKPKNEI